MHCLSSVSIGSSRNSSQRSLKTIRNLPSSRNAAFTQAAYEHVPLPVGKALSGVERHAREDNRWQPHEDRVVSLGDAHQYPANSGKESKDSRRAPDTPKGQ